MSTASAARRTLLVATGWAVLAAGVALLVLPVPASLVIALGLALLATEYRWASRLLAWIPRAKDASIRLLAHAWRRTVARAGR